MYLTKAFSPIYFDTSIKIWGLRFRQPYNPPVLFRNIPKLRNGIKLHKTSDKITSTAFYFIYENYSSNCKLS